MSSDRTDGPIAAWAGFDLSTTGLALGVRAEDGQEAFVQMNMRGATQWKSEPAFDLQHVSRMILGLITRLERVGWRFTNTCLSFSVRQHDMVLLDRQGELATPALSWQSAAAEAEVAQLRRSNAESIVGRVEPRFILPKLMWAIRRESSLRSRVQQVMTTGDWIALMLTGKARLSTSDGLSNGLLRQTDKKLAADVLRQAKLKPEWFPTVIASGRRVGRITVQDLPGSDASWSALREKLAGGQVVAGLGDNHATGVGCGLAEQDFETVVVSAGTSGTINRVCRPSTQLRGQAACFEFYKNRLLLMMLADCCKWYDRFVARHAAKFKNGLDELNALVSAADLRRLDRVLHRNGREIYGPHFSDLTVGEQAASTQLSIMFELLRLVQAMLHEPLNASRPVQRFVLTGGLSQSAFFQQVFHAGVQLLAPRSKVLVSARQGPMRYQTAAYGALLNAMRPHDAQAAGRLCPTQPAARPNLQAKRQLQHLLQSYGLLDDAC